MTAYARAYPRKRFFLDMFTRDISLEDCILDLIDNSIDALLRHRPNAVPLDALEAIGAQPLPHDTLLPRIDLSFSENRFTIEDNCGGIPLKEAKNQAFIFGKPADGNGEASGTLGVYGIGLKRAIFKIGQHLAMRSATPDEGWQVDLDIVEWAKKDDTFDDWRIPITSAPAAKSAKSAGTKIVIDPLRDETKLRLQDGEFAGLLHAHVARTYAWLLDRYVRIKINERPVEPVKIEIGTSAEVSYARDLFELDGVHVELLAGLATRGSSGEWRQETAGWYVMCNLRIVLAANKDEVGGWGGGALPMFQPKYRGFIGLAFFRSSDGLKLPWTTTKRGLNRESAIYMFARNRMRGVARPIITFLDQMYRSGPEESLEERRIATAVKPAPIANMLSANQQSFTVLPPKQTRATKSVNVQYPALKADLDLIRQHLRKADMSASAIGQYTLKYFLKQEALK